MFRIGFLVSGNGTNFQAVVDNINNEYIKNVEIITLVSNNPNSYALERAKKNNIDCLCIDKKDFESNEFYEDYLINHFKTKNVDLIVMAGFMVVIGKKFVDAFKNKIINIHPSLIPSFCGKGYYGLKVHKAVIEKGVKVTGATVHFVTEETDAGPIILQKAVNVEDNDTPEILQERVMKQAEWIILPEAIKLLSEYKIEIVRNIVRRK